ncbi:MAG: lyase family protein [Acidobacteriaceae bacterium]|jgi:aspartate ammonia-lyase
MSEMRRERDSLGVVEVPAGAMYGAQTARAVENYPISGMRASPFLIRAMGMVKKAAAEANGELGVVSKERAGAIARAAGEVIDGKWDGEFVVDVFQAGAGVSFHMNANEVVANRANQLVAGARVRGRGKTNTEREDDAESGGGTKTNTGVLRSAQDDDKKGNDDAEGGSRGQVPGAKARFVSGRGMPGLKSRPISDAEVQDADAEVRQADAEVRQADAVVRQADAEVRQADAEVGEADAEVREAEREALGRYEWVHPNDHVNYGQSTNDVFPTAMRLGTLLALEGLYPVLDSLAEGFALKGVEFDGVVKAGRTHMQDATPIRLGQEFAAYGVAIRKARESIARAAEGLRELGLGGSAVGTGINTHPEYRVLAIRKLAVISGQRLEAASDMRWAMQSCGPMAEVSAALRGLALEVIRIANDLRLMSSGPNTGLNEIAPPSLQPGSSIMPGKINPVLAELAAMVGFQVVGNDTAVAMAVQAGQLELNVMMPTMAYNVLQSVSILTNMLREFDTRCVRGITANAARCAWYAQSTVALATALNPYIGYAKAAELVKESVATGRSVIEIARERGVLSEEQIRKILDVGKMTGA